MHLFGGMEHMLKEIQGKVKFNSWNKMVVKLKGKFMPKEYQLTLFRQIKQKLMYVREYTEEFCRINIRVGYI
jgi:hypothetical protein